MRIVYYIGARVITQYERNSIRSSRIGSKCISHFSTSSSSSSFSSLSGDLASRPEVRAHHILDTFKSKKNLTVSSSATLIDAIKHLVDESIGSSLVVNDKTKEIMGIFTARDILTHLVENRTSFNDPLHNFHVKNGTSNSVPITEIMIPKSKLVFAKPTDSRKRIREMMFHSKVRNLPVIEDGVVLGIITIKMLADSHFSLSEIGGKKAFMHLLTGRKGLPDGTKMPSESNGGQYAVGVQPSLDLLMSEHALPHPFKSIEKGEKGGVSMNRRLYGAGDLCTDMSLCEDAHFALTVGGTDENDSSARSYMCVADGVGSWRQYGVDPREYSHRLVENARKIIQQDSEQRQMLADSPFSEGIYPIHPLDVITDCWTLTAGEEITGSSTICVATLDKKLNQLSYSNIGDCGLMVLRHIDSETAGYMRDRSMPRYLRTNDLKIAYLSQQQLRSFNLPYQLGYSGIEAFKGNFETPSEADTGSFPVLEGDIVILATDGLFDNLDLSEIVEEVGAWEKAKEGPITKEDMRSLAVKLVEKAREYSLDKMRDSPFAILAKENDVMWGGGMPDDTTVVVAKVIINNKIEGKEKEKEIS